MVNQLKKLPKKILEIIKISSRLADDLGYNAYLVGGFVRDLLLNVGNLDVDIVIEYNGLRFSKELAGLLHAHLTQHKRFGTATLKADKFKIDVATSRKEIYEYPGALPKVTFDTIRYDLARRDFTINAMAIAINSKNFGSLIDFFDGKNDIKERKIRILHEKSFFDDPTRIIRAVRFKQRYNFVIERNTYSLIKEAAGARLLQKVQKHRIRDELFLLLKEEKPIQCIKILNKIYGLDFIYPGLKLTKRKILLLKRIQQNIKWLNSVSFKKRSIDEWFMYLIGLLDDLSISKTQALCREFAFGRGVTKRLLSYKSFSKRKVEALFKKLANDMLYKMFEPLSYEVVLGLLARFPNRVFKKNIIDFFIHAHGTKLKITGKDLKRLGVRPGPEYKRILAKILYAKITHKFVHKKEELSYLKKHLKK